MDKYIKDIKKILGNDWKHNGNYYYCLWKHFYGNKDDDFLGVDEKEGIFLYSCTNFEINVRTTELSFETFLNTIKIWTGEINGNKTNTNL